MPTSNVRNTSVDIPLYCQLSTDVQLTKDPANQGKCDSGRQENGRHDDYGGKLGDQS